MAGAHGFRGDICCGSGATGTTAPPNSFLVIGTVGAEAHVARHLHFAFEGGAGPLRVHGRDETGIAFYFGLALLAELGETAP